MTELWRTLVDSEARWEGGWPEETLADLRSPEGVREVVGQRLARLDTGDHRRCSSSRPSPVTSSICRSSAGSPARRLEQAVAHGMIEEVPSRQLAFQFTHELVRRALYDRMPGLRRAELHLRVGEALERDGGARPRVADLAYHFAAAAPIDGPERAVEYALLAGRDAHGDAGLRRGRGPFRGGARARHDGPAARRRDAARARHRLLPRGPFRARDRRATAPPRTSPASWTTPSCWPPPRSGSRRRAGGRRSSTRARSSCSGRRRTRCPRATPRCA